MVYIMSNTLYYHYSTFYKIFTFFQIVILPHMELYVKRFLVEFTLPLVMCMHTVIISIIMCIKVLHGFHFAKNLIL